MVQRDYVGELRSNLAKGWTYEHILELSLLAIVEHLGGPGVEHALLAVLSRTNEYQMNRLHLLIFKTNFFI